MLYNNEPNRKHTPITKKIKRVFVHAKGTDMHARYPEEYYKQFWFDHKDSDEIAIIAQVEGLTQKAVAHWMADVFYQFYIQHYVSEEVKLQQSTGELQKRVRRNLALKRIARERGWSIDKLLKVDTHEQSSWYFKTQASPDLKLRLI